MDGFTSHSACVRYVVLQSFLHAFSSPSDLAVKKIPQLHKTQFKWFLYVTQLKFRVKWIKQDNKGPFK